MLSLDHTFLFNCLNVDELFKSNKDWKLNHWIRKIEKQAKNFGEMSDNKKTQEDRTNKYKGDALELLVEALIKAFPCSKDIGIAEYKIINASNDTGVDGTGIGVIDGLPAAVQVKWRADNYELSGNKDHLTNFTSSAVLHYGVAPNTTTNLLIITTGEKLHYFTDNEMFRNKVRVINREKLRRLVDGNQAFWNLFWKSWRECIKSD